MIMLIAVSFVAIRCTTEVEETPQPQQVQPELMAKSQIDDLIFESLKSNNEFNWSDVSDQVLWSALMHGDSVLTIGYQPAGEADVNSRMSEVNVNDKAWKDSRESLITETTSRMKMLHEDFDSDQMELRSHDVLPFFDVKITNVEMITYYRQHAEVRYTEPLGYEVDFSRFSNGRAESDSGCSNDADYGLPTSD